MFGIFREHRYCVKCIILHIYFGGFLDSEKRKHGKGVLLKNVLRFTYSGFILRKKKESATPPSHYVRFSRLYWHLETEQKNGLLKKLFCFSSDFDENSWSYSYPCVLQFHQVSSKSDERQKSFINSPFFCSEFQSVSGIVKIVHSEDQVPLYNVPNS